MKIQPVSCEIERERLSLTLSIEALFTIGGFMKNTIEKLREHASATSSLWLEEAESRAANRSWLRYSQNIAMLMLDKMEQTGMTQKQLAEKMKCSQQYVSKILKGKENLSLETLSKIEEALDLHLLSAVTVSA